MRNVSVSFSNVLLCQFHIKQDDIGEVWLFMKSNTKSLNVFMSDQHSDFKDVYKNKNNHHIKEARYKVCAWRITK